MTDEEFKQRWLARFKDRLGDDQTMTPADIEELAASSWEAITPAEHREGNEDDPEAAVDEELSYWDDCG